MILNIRQVFYVDDTPSLSVFELRTKARRLVREHGVKIILIDYLQLMNASGMSFGSRQEEVSTISRSLKDEGCVAYDLFESTTRNDVLMICETWSDAKALAAHEQASHFTTLVPRLHQLGEMKLEKFVF